MALLAMTSMAACGMAGEDLFGGRTSPSEGQGGAGSGGAPAGSGGEPAAESASASAAESAASTAQSVSSAAQSVASSAQASSSTGEPPDGPVVWCKGAPCQAGDVCCFNLQNANLDTCGSAGQCGGGFIEIACSGPGDCPGQVCCGDWQNFYTDVSCQATCDDPDVTLCTGDPNACGPEQFCDASQTLGAGYDVCKN